MDILWPALSCGHSEKRQKSPEDVIIVELVSSPLPPLHLLPVPPIVNVVASTQHKTIQTMTNKQNIHESIPIIVQSSSQCTEVDRVSKY